MNLIQNYEQCHLHETPSEPLNKVNLYELFSESSVQDNLLSNSDHLHELFSKSEVIDLSKVVNLKPFIVQFFIKKKSVRAYYYETGINDNPCSVGMQNGCIEKCYV
ncbi:hypothetical protein F8M41_001702 [Gigaspora margarita]|uniref:Uncharacterized protein n=1 Tax=Gigaspora margarita TaxID=4874 RepID=A0A8H4A7W8_GIGMA|nr:hypothetical protein F8M41_001702 [Gigaspora margarita]